MTRFSLFLLVAVLTSAFYLVHLQYRSRTLYTDMDKAQSLARRLESERQTLNVQKRAQAAALRVEGLARTKLGMHEASPSITQYVAVQNNRVQAGSTAFVNAATARTAMGTNP